MGIEFITVSLYHGNCYVGTVSCDTLQVSQQIVECEALLEFTGSILQTADVAGLQFIAKNTDQLAQRLYLSSHLQIIFAERINGQVNHFLNCTLKNADLVLSGWREGDLLLG